MTDRPSLTRAKLSRIFLSPCLSLSLFSSITTSPSFLVSALEDTEVITKYDDVINTAHFEAQLALGRREFLKHYWAANRHGDTMWYRVCDPREAPNEAHDPDSQKPPTKGKKSLGPAIQSLWEEKHCDYYSPGSAMCLMEAHRYNEEEKRERQKILMNSNCQVLPPGQGSGMLTQLFHCPAGLPISLFVLPKCGTTSAINFILDNEPYTRPSLSVAMDSMINRPRVMISWLEDELYNWEMFNHTHAMELSQRLMHRFPGTSEQQQNFDWMRFLPPAHLCPLCCSEQKWRQKVILVRNPFARIASLYHFSWIHEIPEDVDSRFLPFVGWKDFGRWLKLILSERDSGTFYNNVERFDDTSNLRFCNEDEEEYDNIPSYSWHYHNPAEQTEEKDKDYKEQLLENGSRPVHDDGTPWTDEEIEESSKKEKMIEDSNGQKNYLVYRTENTAALEEKTRVCRYFRRHIEAGDVFHMRPFADMIEAEIFKKVNGEIEVKSLDNLKNNKNKDGEFFIVHLETVEEDLKRLYSKLCSEYGYCREAPKRFPKVMPVDNRVRKTCKFNSKKVEYENCGITWKELWTEENIALMQKHYGRDIELFGYKDTPDFVMPLKG